MKNLFKKLSLVALAVFSLLVCSGGVYAQSFSNPDHWYVGNIYTTSYGNYFPYYARAKTATEIVYHADEMGNKPQTLRSMAFLVYTKTGTGSMDNISIYMKHSSLATALPATGAVDTSAAGGWVRVFNTKTVNLSSNVGQWHVFNFDTPFQYNGNQTLHILVARNGTAALSSYYTFATNYTYYRPYGGEYGYLMRYVSTSGSASFGSRLSYRPFVCFNRAASETNYTTDVQMENATTYKRDAAAAPIGGSTQYFYLSTSYSKPSTEMLYSAAEVGTGPTMIESVSFYTYSCTPVSGIPENSSPIEVYLRNTTETSLPSGTTYLVEDAVNAGTLVYSGSYKMAGGAGDPNPYIGCRWVTIKFDRPFFYTGENLALMVRGQSKPTANVYHTFYTYNRAASSCRYTYVDASNTYWQYGSNYPVVARWGYQMGPEISKIRPGANSTLLKKIYNQALPTTAVEEKPGFEISVERVNTNVNYPQLLRAYYEIVGPGDKQDVVYRMVDPATPSRDYVLLDRMTADANGILRYDVQRATGPAVWQVTGGDNKSLDLRATGVKPGVYTSKLRIMPESTLPSYQGRVYESFETFNLRVENDLAAVGIISPVRNTSGAYPMKDLTVGINLQGSVENFGVNPIDSFWVQASIYEVDYDTHTGQAISKTLLEKKPAYLIKLTTPLVSGQKYGLTENHLGTYLPTKSGYYAMEIEAWFADTTIVDQELSNNVFPAATDRLYLFKTAEYVDPEVVGIKHPALNEKFSLGRTITPITTICNNGLRDLNTADNLSIKTTIYKEFPAGSGNYTTQVFTNTYQVDALQPGSVDEDVQSYDQDITGKPLKGWLINDVGKYKIISEFIWNQQISPQKISKQSYFEVIPGLAGTYRIGTGAGNHYATIDAAVNDLYRLGVSQPVNFELQDAHYTVGTLDTTIRATVYSGDRNSEFTIIKAYAPALDMRSRIVGVHDTIFAADGKTIKEIRINPITFKPSYERSKNKSAVTVNFRSRSGIGFMAGPCDTPSVKEAIVWEATYAQKRKWGSSDGYINFDGGDNKSLKFTLETGGNEYRAPFYFNGVGNCSIKNCIIEDGIMQERSYQYTLPGVTYNGADMVIAQDWVPGAVAANNYTYSAGIVLRTTTPHQNTYSSNAYRFDTVYCNNINIENNEISKFTYGVVSIGIGKILAENPFIVDIVDTNRTITLADMQRDTKLEFVTQQYKVVGAEQELIHVFRVKDSRTNRGYWFNKYYEYTNLTTGAKRSFTVVIDSSFGGYKRANNYNNTIKGNLITDMGRAGIFLGYEEDTKILNNRIHGIIGVVKEPNGSITNMDCAGIYIGGRHRGDKFDGFNSVGLTIANNEISNIYSEVSATGIKYEQTRIYDRMMGTEFPDRAERTKMFNNIVWGIYGKNAGAERCGISVSPSLRLATTPVPYYEMEDIKYHINNVTVANNTVVMTDDKMSDSRGNYIGIKLQKIKNSNINNNAVCLSDTTFDNNRLEIASVIFYQGAEPIAAKNNINYNVYQRNANSPINAYRYINTDLVTGTVIDTGYVNEYRQLEQWQNWMKADYYSVNRDFYKEMFYTDENIPKLRVIQEPLPVNSALDNRGMRISSNETDIDGRLRGIGDQKGDIGAQEISSVRYSVDFEVVNFASPATYKGNAGPFADAEYHMIDNKPVVAKVRVRNNGNVTLSNKNLSLKVYRESVNINQINTNIHNYNFTEKYYNNEAAHNGDNSIFTSVVSSGVGAVLAATADTLVILSPGDEFEIEMSLYANGTKTPWTPETYRELIRDGNNYSVPIHFSRMINNVTPRYKFVLEAQTKFDEDITNNTIEKTVRYYVKKSNLDMIISAYGTYHVINTILANGKEVENEKVKNPDFIAGRLNLDTLLAGLKRIGVEPISPENEDYPFYGVDIFDRKGWDYRNVGYTMYKTMFISDELEVSVDRWSRNKYDFVYRTFQDKYFTRNIMDYLNNNISGADKINLILGSENYILDAYSNFDFMALNQPEKLNLVRNYFHAGLHQEKVTPEAGSTLDFFKTPLYDIKKIHDPNSPPISTDSIWTRLPLSYSGKTVTGMTLGRTDINGIVKTGWQNQYISDNEPYGIIYKQLDHIDGFTSIGNIFDTVQTTQSMVNIPNSKKIMSLASSNSKLNIIALGFDWRHFKNVEKILRSIEDFVVENNGQMVVPVSLYGFTAYPVGNRVELQWQTASEHNTERFDIERAEIKNNSTSDFIKIDKVNAVGSSATDMSYTSTDKQVLANSTYVYRLKVVDFDGTYAYSDERVVALSGGLGLEISEITPSPASDKANINIKLDNDATVSVDVYDISGKLLFNIINTSLLSGNNILDINTSDLSSGTYNLVIRINNTQTIKMFNVIK